jgi:hypothetical protein
MKRYYYVYVRSVDPDTLDLVWSVHVCLPDATTKTDVLAWAKDRYDGEAFGFVDCGNVCPPRFIAGAIELGMKGN